MSRREDYHTSTADGAAAFERYHSDHYDDAPDPADYIDPEPCPECGSLDVDWSSDDAECLSCGEVWW
jgi:hypothetical protein